MIQRHGAVLKNMEQRHGAVLKEQSTWNGPQRDRTWSSLEREQSMWKVWGGTWSSPERQSMERSEGNS
jgi:hypothetical protein